jgi:retron-type reverse transcriptase
MHGHYEHFKINDPKPRDIHKASVRDRLLHHALYRKLYPFFDGTFISDSYSCRLRKGTHKALKRFEEFGHRMSKNNTRTCWVLKCDIRKFFANINHQIIFSILAEYISDENVQWLLEKVISSFQTGLPLGNLTSQLLVNIYMDEFDQYVKHKLKVKHYIRYADDFVFLSDDKTLLEQLIPQISDFLNIMLKLSLHPNKVSIATLASGVDFLGWVHFPDHRVLRTTTKKRMFRNLQKKLHNPATLQSYLGLLKHGNTQKLQEML